MSNVLMTTAHKFRKLETIQTPLNPHQIMEFAITYPLLVALDECLICPTAVHASDFGLSYRLWYPNRFECATMYVNDGVVAIRHDDSRIGVQIHTHNKTLDEIVTAISQYLKSI